MGELTLYVDELKIRYKLINLIDVSFTHMVKNL